MLLLCNDSSTLFPPVNPFNRVTSPQGTLHHGRGLLPKVATMKTPLERFWAKVNKRGPIPKHMPHLGRCWVWEGGKTERGYGLFYLDSQRWRAHRWIYNRTICEIPDNLVCCHKCDNPSCERPSHLFAGTHKDNTTDCKLKGRLNNPRRTHCRKGHTLTTANSITRQIRGKEARECRACHIQRNKNYYRLKAARKNKAL